MTHPTTPAEIVDADRDAAKAAAAVAVAMRAPYSYADLARAHRAGALVELLSVLDSYTLRAQAVRYCLESPSPMRVEEVERRFCRLLSESRWQRAV